MGAKKFGSGLTLAALLTLLGAGSAGAGPYLGEWSWFWHPAPDCPRGAYSPMHYWAPSAYQLRAQVHPMNVDQYPPGLPVGNGYEIEKHRCPSTPPTPLSPYADPDNYFGRPTTPPRN